MHAIRLSVASFGSAGPATFVAAPGKHERFKAGGDVLLAALKKSWPELGSARVARVRADRERPFRIDESASGVQANKHPVADS